MHFISKLAVLAFVVAALWAYSAWSEKAIAYDENVETQMLEMERLANRGSYPNDGVFEGSAEGFGGPVVMRVTIDNGYIDSVEIVDVSLEDPPWVEMCEGLPDKIVRLQTSNIDVVSGATYTSAGMLNGVAEALKQATGGA